jgi:pSer/pThr/pTyr-binding forkhead associated (FHA) protein
MAHEPPISDDPGTILETYRGVPVAKPIGGQGGPVAPAGAAAVSIEEVLYKSPYRWPAPRIVICNEGSLEEGELFYVRSDKVTIGRTAGDIMIKHDASMSASHAEIARRDIGGKYMWVLQDLGSSNGTLVKVQAVTLKPGMTIQLGSKRYQFKTPGHTAGSSGNATSAKDDPGTYQLADLSRMHADALPALVENPTPGSVDLARYPFRATKITVGRPGCGNDIEIDDLCLAAHHAVITRDASGSWHLEPLASLNGVWAKVSTIGLKDDCHFQCGEQRFRFMLP